MYVLKTSSVLNIILLSKILYCIESSYKIFVFDKLYTIILIFYFFYKVCAALKFQCTVK